MGNLFHLEEKRGLSIFLVRKLALAGVTQWIEHGPEKQRVASSIPSQGTCLACRLGPWLGA